MYWIGKSWEKEDVEFAPKRKVDNKDSKERHHVIGAFHSHKMNVVAEYESLTEWAFYSLLELDKDTVRYYVQPVRIHVPYSDDFGNLKSWVHVPDVLVFREGSIPHLYQTKESLDDSREKLKIIDKACERYAASRGWNYSVIYPKSLPKVVSRNIDFLAGFTKTRKWFDSYSPQVISKLRFIGQTAITELSQSFVPQYDPLLVLPVIYHLIAKGYLWVNINEPISEYSMVRISSNSDRLLLQIEQEEEV
ncbi:TnsA endonuclease N-terminal domain-containing protein [Alicyclobacillus suci]|uniref:TnsA endonuclease N-terminal domain-containing protein n=1 Tax=Alicyclobacillus suci TaxID=2816080 RepID=UPI001A8CC0E4|nr:TnsA endonuclease N-terminal domain-containing protein [Alicyclobacillus suci]